MKDFIKEAIDAYNKANWNASYVNEDYARDLFDIIRKQKDYSEKELETKADNIIHDLITGESGRKILTSQSENKHLDFYTNFMDKENRERLFDTLDDLQIPYNFLTGIKKANINTTIQHTVNLPDGRKLSIEVEWERQDGSPILTEFTLELTDEYGKFKKIYELDSDIDYNSLFKKEEEKIIEKAKRELERTGKTRKVVDEFRSHTGTRFKKYVSKNGKVFYGYYTSENKFRFAKHNSAEWSEAVINDKHKRG